MKNLILLSTLMVMSFCYAYAQNVTNLLQPKTNLTSNFSKVASKYEAFDINRQSLASLRAQSPSRFTLEVPFENQVMKINLEKVSITAPGFSVMEALPNGGRDTIDYSEGIFYQGRIEGQQRSFATFSLFNDQMMGVIADGSSNIVLGAIEANGLATSEYTMYRENNLLIANPFRCETPESPIGESIQQSVAASRLQTNSITNAVGEPVDIYFECDYKFYQDKGSNTNNVINYVLGFFNNTALLYANEQIKIQVSQILVWTTQDPEAAAGANTTSAVLNLFAPRMGTTNYIGDYAHFLSTRSLGGGVAYVLGNPCLSQKRNRTAVSGISNTYNNFPTYSWTVEVVTHELGHNLGSQHTQWCGWVGGALDNCVATEGGCDPGPAPTNGGTIMSYCHLTSTGINFNNGFGQQPGDRIRAVVGAATCFANCKMTIDVTKIDASCGQNNGSATVTQTNGVAPFTYTWSNGQTGATLSNVGPGTYNVTVTDGTNCQVMQVVTIINTGSTLNATLSPSVPTSFCAGSNVVLTASTGTGYTYQWYKDAVLIAGASANVYTATTSGNYSVTISAGACNVSRSVQISEVAIPVATITAGGPLTFCTGGSVVLNGNAGSSYTYQWYNNGNAINGATNPAYTANASGSYTVRVSANGCQSTSTPVIVVANITPTAAITASGSTTFCTGGNVILSTATGTGYAYQWYNNGNAIGSATNNTYTASTSGSYTVKTTANGCEATSAAVVVTAAPAPTATVTASGATTICSGTNLTLTASTGTGYSYQWLNNGNAINGATNSTYAVTASGSYSVRISVGSCTATSTSVSATVNPTPTAIITAGGPVTFCSGGNVVLNASTGTGYSYQWYNNGNAIGGATNSTYTATASGSYTIKVTAGSCEATSAATVVTAAPVPSATITAGGATTFCAGNSVTLSAATGTGYNYQWRNNGNVISGANNATYVANTSGIYSVVISIANCSATSTDIAVTVNPAPTANITAGGPLTFCAGGSVLLSASTGTGYIYQWYNNGNVISGATNSSYTATTTGSYTVKVTASGCEVTSSATVVTAAPVPSATISAGGSTTICAGNSVTLSAATGTGYTYQWRNNGNAINGATSATYNATATGVYSVVVSVANCSTTSANITVTVNPAPTASVTAGGPVSFCAGGNVVLSASTGSGYSYQWLNNGNTINGATSATYTATTSGSYSVRITASGCSTTSGALNVTANPIPQALITAGSSTAFCIGGSVTLQANSGSGFSYQWYINGSAISNATNSSYTANSTGNYTVRVTSNGCEATSAVTTVTTSAAPQAAISAAGPLSFCSGGSVVLNANTGTGYNYQWQRNGSNINGATNSSYTATQSGDYSVTISLGSCSSTAPVRTVAVLAAPLITLSPLVSTINQGQTQTITASGAASYNWSAQPGLVSSTTNSVTVRPSSTTTYAIEGTGSNGCKSTATAQVIVIGCGDVTNITSQVLSPSRVMIKWTNPSGVTTDSIRYRKAGTSIWSRVFVVGNQYELSGLESNSNYEFNVIPLCSANAFIPSATHNFTTTVLSTGIYLRLFPNPVSTMAKVEVIIDAPYTLQVEVINNWGQRVKPMTTVNSPAGQSLINIDVTGLSNGLYFVNVYINGKKYPLKMVVAK